MKTNWNLALLYTSKNDPAIERDLKDMEVAYAQFEKKYRGKNFTSSARSLAKALGDYEKLHQQTGSFKPYNYFAFLSDLNSADNELKARLQKLGDRYTKAGNKIQFFDLAIGKIPAAKQKLFLNDSLLKKYKRYLDRSFETAKHDLTEPEEKILALKATTGRGMWISGVNNAVNTRMVTFKGKIIPLNKALSEVSGLKSQRDRKALWSAIVTQLKTIEEFAESEINAVFTDKKISDELRGFNEPYERTILSYENEPSIVLELAKIVTKRFDLSKKFYALKKRMMKLPVMFYSDRVATLGGVTRKYSFSDSVALVSEAFSKADKKYKDILHEYLKKGQIDVYPKKGKEGGAYCASAYDLPSFVLLNHTDKFTSLTTLAHEMGHAIHNERTRSSQPIFTQGYSTSVAETASTFFEGLVFEHVVATLPKKEKIAALRQRIEDDMGTIFRQIAFFNFELELHRAIRAKGWVPKKEISQMFVRHMKEHLGSAISMQEDDGLSYIYIGHFRRPFYVYSYAYGQLISKALLARVKKDPSYIKKVDEFLCAGRSKAPEKIFSDIGITVGKELFEEGLNSIQDDIRELDQLTKGR